MRIVANASHYDATTTVRVAEDKYTGKVEYILEYRDGKWFANGLRIQADSQSIRDVRQLLTDADNLKKEIGASRDPAEIIRRFMLCMEAESVRFYTGYGDDEKAYRMDMKVGEYLDNPRNFIDGIVRFHEFKVSKKGE